MKTEAIDLPVKLVRDARAKLENERGLELETYVAMYLRLMLRSKNTNSLDRRPSLHRSDPTLLFVLSRRRPKGPLVT